MVDVVRRRAEQRDNYAANREANAAAARDRYWRNRDHILARRRLHRATNREAINTKRRADYAANPGRTTSMLIARRRSQHRANARYYATHRVDERARADAYMKSRPGIKRVWALRRRARQIGNGGTHTRSEWFQRLGYFEERCAYCPAGPNVILERDHIVPLSRGGTDDIENIVPACRSCNARKGKRTAIEYLALAAA